MVATSRKTLAILGAAFLAALVITACRNVEGPSGDRDPRENVLSVALATLPTSFQEAQVASGLASPTAMAFAPDGRLFICEKGGRLRVVKSGALLATPFLTRSGNAESERGLLGVAIDPDFATTRHVFIYYTTGSPYHNRLSRYTAQAGNLDVADPASEVPLLDLENLSAGNHNGGAIHFGPDGKLYVATGENAVNSNSQSMSNRLGKILRINKDGTIPTDNPFYGTATGDNRAIWALGLRNPFTFAFQPGTGKMFINDVGWMSWEEINEGVAGANYGWPTTEGPTTNASFRTPFHAYQNDRNSLGDGEGCAIIGAAFYNPATSLFPSDYAGDYFYGDHCGGWIRRIDPVTKTVTPFATGVSSLVDLEVGADGALYYLTYSGGLLTKVTYSTSQAPSISQHPQNVTVPVGAAATFTVSASGSGLSYQWQRGGSDISGATSASYTLASPQTTDNGAVFRCRVTNTHGTATSNEATLTVTTNKPPVATILTPDAASLYRAGGSLAYSGSATDPEDGTLAGAAFTWQVDFHHETHSHPLMSATTGATGGTLNIPTVGESSANVWLRIHLTVTDKDGLTHKVTRDIHPRKATVTLATDPAGLAVTLDGAPVTAPYSFQGVAGHSRTLGAADQVSGGKTWEFVSWSDAGAAEHDITTPDTNRTYTAVFKEAAPNAAPTAAIATPDTAFRYRAGTAIAFSGTATDPEDGTLAGTAFAWSADLHHTSQTHALMGSTSGTSGSFTVPADLELSPDVFVRLHLTARDRHGVTHHVQRDIQPRKVPITLATSPAGLSLELDGAVVTSPHAFTSVAGVRRGVEASSQSAQGKVWQFQSWSDGGAAQHSLTTPDTALTLTATFTEAVGNQPPTANISTPVAGTLYEGGTTVAFAGSGTDPESGALADAAHTWRVDSHHDGHTHPILASTSGIKTGTFQIPTVTEVSASVFYRITLTVRDPQGLTHTATRDLQPHRVQLTLASVPSGLRLLLDGAERTTPYVFNSVVGVTRAVQAPAQDAQGKSWLFSSWSDQGSSSHGIVTPSANTTFTARFVEKGPNQPPVGEILTPSPALLYEGGQQVAYSATGTDAEDGALPDTAFTWRVDFHHAGHMHPLLPATKGAKSGTVTVPSEGEVAPDVFYRIHLSVRDKGGMIHESWRDVKPKLVEITLASEPAGLKLRLDGITVTTPHVFTGVAGLKRPLQALLGQDMGGKAWAFKAWSHGGEATQTLVTPSVSGTLTATYETSVSTGIKR